MHTAGQPYRRRLRPSQWPKTTLGATNDGIAPLSLTELLDLKKLCNQHTARLFELSVRATSVRVHSLTISSYTRRGLEADGRTESRGVPLEAPASADVEGFEEGPSAEERTRVASVLSEWDDEPAYLLRVVADGSRISTYREASSSGTSLVAFLRDAAPSLSTAFATFRSAVDVRFPGRFAWLADESLHVTVRALASD